MAEFQSDTMYVPTPKFKLVRKVPKSDESVYSSPTSHSVWLPTRNIGATLSNAMHWKTLMVEFLLYVTLVITGALSSEHYRSPYLRSVEEAIEVGFTDRKFVTTNDITITFAEISSCSDVWTYMKTLLIDNIYPSPIYHEDIFKVVPDKMQLKRTVLDHHILIGVPRIGQSRVRKDSCEIHPVFTKMYDKCYGPYSELNKDTEEFFVSNQYDAFRYKNDSLANSVDYQTEFTRYPGSGYYMDLFDNKEETKAALTYLEQNLWITRATRFVFFTFTIYNPTYEVFANVRLGFIFPTVGGVIPLDATQLFIYRNDWVGFISSIIYHLVTLAILGIWIRDIFYFKSRIFFMFWTYLDFVYLVLSYICLYNFLQFSELEAHLNSLDINEKVYGNIENVWYYFTAERDTVVVALYLNCISLYRFTTVSAKLQQLNLTIKKCFISVLSFSIMFVIVFCAFSAFAFLVFGSKVEGYHTFIDCMITLFCSVLGELNYNDLYEVNYIFAPFFFISFTFLVFFVLLNMFQAIINDSYYDVATELSMEKQHQLWGYLKSVCCPSFWSKKKPKRKFTQQEIRSFLKTCGYDAEAINDYIAYSLNNASQPSFLEENNTDEQSEHVSEEDIQLYQQRLDHIAATIAECNKSIMNIHAALESIQNIDIKEAKTK